MTHKMKMPDIMFQKCLEIYEFAPIVICSSEVENEIHHETHHSHLFTRLKKIFHHISSHCTYASH